MKLALWLSIQVSAIYMADIIFFNKESNKKLLIFQKRNYQEIFKNLYQTR